MNGLQYKNALVGRIRLYVIREFAMKKKHLICIGILLALAISSCRSNTLGTENKQLELLSQPVDSEYSESAIENVVNDELQSYVSDDFAVGNVIDFGVYNDQTLQWQVLTVDNGMALLFLNNNIQTEDGSDYALPYNEEGGKPHGLIAH